MRTLNTSYITRNLEFGMQQKLCCITLCFLSRFPSEKPIDFSCLVFSRTGTVRLHESLFSNWPLKLAHANLRHSACDLKLGKHVAPSLVYRDSILVRKENLIRNLAVRKSFSTHIWQSKYFGIFYTVSHLTSTEVSCTFASVCIAVTVWVSEPLKVGPANTKIRTDFPLEPSPDEHCNLDFCE